MVSKKVIAPALAGTGVIGASGALAWSLGVFDGGGQEDVEVEEKDIPDAKLENPTADKGIGVSPVKRVPKKTWSTYFAAGGGATEHDRRVIDSNLTLEVEWKKVMQSIWVSAEEKEEGNETKFSWECQLSPIAVEDRIDSNHKFEEFERQKKQLEEALREDDNKKQFVTNCSRAKLTEENSLGGARRVIELETEKITWEKYKFKEKEEYFKRLWTEDFTGAYGLSEEEENAAKSKENWNIKEETEGKITVTLGRKDSTCNIYGDYSGNLEGKTFKGDKLKEILEMNEYSFEIEKKKYILRNCLKNNKDIRGLKIKSNGSNWWFDDDGLKKVSEGMYENPAEVKP